MNSSKRGAASGFRLQSLDLVSELVHCNFKHQVFCYAGLQYYICRKLKAKVRVLGSSFCSSHERWLNLHIETFDVEESEAETKRLMESKENLISIFVCKTHSVLVSFSC